MFLFSGRHTPPVDFVVDSIMFGTLFCGRLFYLRVLGTWVRSQQTRTGKAQQCMLYGGPQFLASSLLIGLELPSRKKSHKVFYNQVGKFGAIMFP